MSEAKVVVCPQCGKKYKLAAAFEAASFQCKACAATVWVEKKPAASSARTKSGRGRSAGRAAGRKAKGGRAAPARHRARREPTEEPGEGSGERRPRYQRQKSKSGLIVGLVAVVIVGGVGVAYMVSKNKKEGGTSTAFRDLMEFPDGQAPEPAEVAANGAGTAAQKATQDAAAKKKEGETEGTEKDSAAKKGSDAVAEEEQPRPTKKLGGSRRKHADGRLRLSKWDPPPDIPHLKETTPEERKKIDEAIVTMMDPDMGRDSHIAKQDLVFMGKKAFPRVLASMAKIRDTITDVDNDEERLIESSLRLADGCLREMDGYLNAYNKTRLSIGCTKRYITYICRLHYKRWIKDLQKMPKMPGPHDPSLDHEEAKPEEFDGGK